MEFKSYIKKYQDRINNINNLFNLDELNISFDNLRRRKKTSHELLYFSFDNKEVTGLFVFGFDFFIAELSEQEFKNVIGSNSLNFKIYSAYHKLKKKQKKIKISDILNQIQNKSKDSNQIHKYLRRILVLAYYLNWDLKKDLSDLEGDSFIEIPNKYLVKLKQRFDFKQIAAIYENEDLFLFLNSRGKLNLVFKDLYEFSKKDIEKHVLKVLKKVFSIKKINL